MRRNECTTQLRRKEREKKFPFPSPVQKFPSPNNNPPHNPSNTTTPLFLYFRFRRSGKMEKQGTKKKGLNWNKINLVFLEKTES